MGATLPLDDLRFLLDVDRLGKQGLTQTEIAVRLRLSGAATLQQRLQRMGFRLQPCNEVRLALTGESLVDAVASGLITAADANGHAEPERAEVVA